MKKTIAQMTGALVLTAFALMFGTVAHAQSAGSIQVTLGAMSIHPDLDSGNLSSPSQPGTKIDTSKSSTQPAAGINYMLTDNWSVQLPLATPFEFDIKGAGAIRGAGKIGSTKVLPFSLFGQYHFGESENSLRPFVGLGATYSYFYDTKATGTLTGLTNPGGKDTTMKIDSKWALTPQLGVDWRFSGNWFAQLVVDKSFLKTTSKLSTGQHIDITMDPWVFGAFVGYSF
jgi:outer membrane protein